MGRINYSLMDRYLITLTGRWDGASMLAVDNKYPRCRMTHMPKRYWDNMTEFQREETAGRLE